jgi:toxin ParE1/3/4
LTLRAAVTFAESAVRDLEELGRWFEAQGMPEVGTRLVREVIESAEQLAEFPESGRVVPEFGSPWLRELVRTPLRIVYRLDANRVRVVRVWRSARTMEEPHEDAEHAGATDDRGRR